MLRELRERHGARGIPAVALTAYVSLPDRDAVLAAGFDVHVPKPVDIQRLLGAIAGLLGRSFRPS